MTSEKKRALTARAFVLMIASFVLTTFAFAQRMEPDTGEAGTGGNYVIVGSLFFPSSQRVDRRVRVRLHTPTRGDITSMTDDSGRFAFRRLAPGSYEVVIDDEKDYEPVRQRVSIFQTTRSGIGAEQIYSIQIRLTLKGARDLKPAVINAELAGVPPQALKFYDKALKLGQAGNSKGAVEQLQRAIAEHPKFGLAFTELGAQYLKLGEMDKAEQALRSAVELLPDSFPARMNYGILLVRLNRFVEAERELRRALELDEKSAVAHYYLGRALAYLGRYDNAEVELNLALSFGGEEMKEAHRYLAGIYNARGKTKRAIAELEIYLKLAPNSPDAAELRKMIAKLRSSVQPVKQ